MIPHHTGEAKRVLARFDQARRAVSWSGNGSRGWIQKQGGRSFSTSMSWNTFGRSGCRYAGHLGEGCGSFGATSWMAVRPG